MVQLGCIYAAIAGDSRYTDRMEVQFDDDTGFIHVIVSSTAPIGGMDGPGGVSGFVEQEHQVLAANLKLVAQCIKQLLGNTRFNFKRYGKPTRRFIWYTLDGRKLGFSQALIKEALASVA